MMRTRLFLLLLLFSLSCLAARAQVATGYQPFGSYTRYSFDTVNNANLNVDFAVPIMSKQGRGLPFYFSLVYDSSIWYKSPVGGAYSWIPVGGWGWHSNTDVETGYVTYDQTLSQCDVFNPDGTSWQSNYYSYSHFVYHDQLNGLHPFNGAVQDADSDCGQSADSYNFTTLDGSGYTINATGGSSQYSSPTIKMLPRAGENINPVQVNGTGNGSRKDRNGNLVSATYNYSTKVTTFTDTLGTTALTISSPTATSKTFTYTSAAGTQGTVTATYTPYTVRTNFGCSGVVEFGPTSENLLTSIALDDGETYRFTYESTPGFAGDVTGRLASVTLPTGGTISYAYEDAGNTIPNDGIDCSDGSTTYLARTTPDGAWTYTHSEAGTAWTTTVSGPSGYSATYNFQQVLGTQNTYETERQVSGLKTIYTCYNGASYPCNGTSVSLPISRITKTVSLPTGQKSQTNTLYNSNGLPTEVDEYDFGSGGVGALLRKTLTSYAALGNNIVDRPSSITIQNGSGATVSSTTFGYDGTAVTATSATPSHQAVTGSRGNLTSVSSGGLTTNFTYYDTGIVQTVTGPNGSQTTYNSGTGACGNSFPTSISLPMSLSTSEAWNCDGAVISSSTDANGKQTTYDYDNMNRLTHTGYPDGGSVSISYSPNQISTTTAITSTTSRTDTTHLDGLGRVSSQTVRGVTTSTTYDGLGRVYTVSVSGSNAQDTYQYDGLGRTTQITHADNNTVDMSYSGNCVTRTGEAGKTRKTCSDALGRVTRVTEDPGTSPHLNYLTTYTYDVLNDLTGIAQGTQSRGYAYDSLGRVKQATTPESGTTFYTYDSDATCGTSAGDLVKSVDARGIRTCYVYDALHRLTQKNYSDGVTPADKFYYDETLVVNGVTTVNTKGRMSHTWNGQDNTIYSYDPMGRVSDYLQNEPAHSGFWNTHYNYDLAGDITSWTHPAGFTITNQIDNNQRISEIDSSLNDSTHPGMLAHMTYTGWGALATLLNGCAGTGCVQRQETYDYNNRLQPVRIQLGTATNASANYCLVYNYYAGTANPTTCTANPAQPASGDNGNVMGYLYQDAANTSLQHSVAYTFDGVNRLASATAKDLSSNTLWTQSYVYTTDSSNGQFGNMTCMLGGSGYCPQVTFSSTTNRVSQIGSLSATFDAAGNMTSDGTHTYQWDAAGRMVSVDSGSTATYKYNALGQRVERFLTNGSWTFDYLFGQSGEELGLYSAGTSAWFNQDVPMGRRVLVKYGSPLRILHANKLGTTTVVTDQTGAELEDHLFYPWGQSWTLTGRGYDNHFAGMKGFESPEQLYPTDFRKYNPALGRWMSPDPLAGDVSNPQSLNRYAYVLNNPVSNIDPSGLQTCADDANSVDTCVDVVGYLDPGDNVGLLPSQSSGHLVDNGGSGAAGGGGGGGTAAKNSSKPCSAGSLSLFNDTLRLSTDPNGNLNGASFLLSQQQPFSQQVQGYNISFPPNTRLALQFTNLPAPSSLEIASNNPASIRANFLTSAMIRSITFDGSFHVNGDLVFLGVPLGSGAIENRLNRNIPLVLKATDLLNKLRANPVSPCG